MRRRAQRMQRPPCVSRFAWGFHSRVTIRRSVNMCFIVSNNGGIHRERAGDSSVQYVVRRALFYRFGDRKCPVFLSISRTTAPPWFSARPATTIFCRSETRKMRPFALRSNLTNDDHGTCLPERIVIPSSWIVRGYLGTKYKSTNKNRPPVQTTKMVAMTKNLMFNSTSIDPLGCVGADRISAGGAYGFKVCCPI